ncbi:unnamed protein product [marine sediment metagenome]|uniref:Uncharacterized protein n=1 Tax=marine sediment metagenome TaxID=412755 RepID=X1B3P4_9ZZZZ
MDKDAVIGIEWVTENASFLGDLFGLLGGNAALHSIQDSFDRLIKRLLEYQIH